MSLPCVVQVYNFASAQNKKNKKEQDSAIFYDYKSASLPVSEHYIDQASGKISVCAAKCYFSVKLSELSCNKTLLPTPITCWLMTHVSWISIDPTENVLHILPTDLHSKLGKGVRIVRQYNPLFVWMSVLNYYLDIDMFSQNGQKSTTSGTWKILRNIFFN